MKHVNRCTMSSSVLTTIHFFSCSSNTGGLAVGAAGAGFEPGLGALGGGPDALKGAGPDLTPVV